MAAKQLRYGENARRALEKGVDTVANAVRSTLGPKGCYASSTRASAARPSPMTAS